MPARSLNLGILAHVDAGKTTLTERLLHLAGVIDEPGSVDSGTTQTDSLALERRRGITIKAAVVSFPLGDTTVNVVDTPGHPDFIAEVERVARRARRRRARAVGGRGGPAADPDPDARAAAAPRADPAVRQQDRPHRRRRRRGHGRDPPPAQPRHPADGRRRGAGSRAATFSAYRPDDGAFRERETVALAEHDDALLAAYVEGRRRRPGCCRAAPPRPRAACCTRCTPARRRPVPASPS